MSIISTSRKLHKWLMLFIGLQFLIWASTGSYMVIMSIDYIHGDSLVTNEALPINANQLKVPLSVIQNSYPNAKQINITTLFADSSTSQVVYQFRQGKTWHLVNATSGMLLPNISKIQAQNIAKAHYTGSGAIIDSTLVTKANGEINPRVLPAWKIQFADVGSPRLYISLQTGEMVTKRHNFWSVFDWLYRFHIMDYGEQENASNRLLLIIAMFAAVASITGVVLTYVSFVKVRGKAILPPKMSSKHHTTTIKQSKIKWIAWIRFAHRWLSLLVFLQLFIWLSTGLYFNLMNHQKASGNQHRQQLVEPIKKLSKHTLYPLTNVLRQFPLATSIQVVERLTQPYYLVTLSSGLYNNLVRHQQLINANNGQLFTVNEEQVKRIALQSYNGDGKLLKVRKLIPPINELPKQHNALWRVDFNDKLETSVYIDNQNAQVIAHVDDDKRLADLMFQLHFMDYANHGSFNNGIIIFMALLTLLFALTGVYWLAHLIQHRQFRFR